MCYIKDISYSNRINWIDIAKGIGIILVVLSHLTENGQILRKVIFSFHMPLFFFLSGLVLKVNIPFLEYLKKKFKGVYFPFLFFLITDYCCGFIFNIIKYGFSINMVKDIFVTFLKSVSGTYIIQNGYTFNPPIWFLCVLFFAEIFLFFVLKLPKCILIVLLPFFVFLSYFTTFYLPFCISYLPTVSLFMISGFLLKDYILYFEKVLYCKIKKFLILIANLIISFLLVYVLSINNEIISMQSLDFGNPILFFLCAFLGINSIISLSMIVAEMKCSDLLIYFGKNSIVIMCTHFYFCRLLLPYIIDMLGMLEYLYCLLTELILAVVVMIIMIPIISFVNKYLYFIFGKGKLRGNLNA